MNRVQKTIYFTEGLIEKIGEAKSFSQRVIDLVQKGIEYESKSENNKITLEQALGYFNWQYKKKHPQNDLPILK